MPLQLDMRVVELLSSRLCHDLVSPIGAVNNGLELLEEDPDPELIEDAVKLARNSAYQASAYVQFYRLAYGRGGRWLDATPPELRKVTQDYLAAHKTDLAWQVDASGDDAPAGSGKLMLNMVAFAAEMLPRGGTLEVRAGYADGLDIRVTATGDKATIRDDLRAATNLDHSSDDLTPRTVQAYFTALLAADLGGGLAVEDTGDSRIVQRVTVPGG